MLADAPFRHTVEFTASVPNELRWWVRDATGNQIAGDTITVAPDAISVTIEIPASANTLPPGAFSATRRLYWVYGSDTGRIQYEIHDELPYGASEEGVRQKLGVPDHNLPDDEIDLVSAFYKLPAPAAPLTPMQERTVRHGIEALAALAVLPTMPLRIAQKESSGTDQYTRGRIDWAAIDDQLRAHIDEALEVLEPSGTAVASGLFVVARVADRFVG